MFVQAEFTEDPSTAADLVRVSGWKQADDAGKGVRDLTQEDALITSLRFSSHLVLTGSCHYTDFPGEVKVKVSQTGACAVAQMAGHDIQLILLCCTNWTATACYF